jgi:hypothetical protein
MSKTLFYLLLILSIPYFCSCNSTQTKNFIKSSIVAEYEIKDSSFNKNSFRIMESSEKLAKTINDTLSILSKYASVLSQFKYDFETYDYLISWGDRNEKIYYLNNYDGLYDECPELKKIPVLLFAEHKVKGKALIIFKIFEKGKYREPCP